MVTVFCRALPAPMLLRSCRVLTWQIFERHEEHLGGNKLSRNHASIFKEKPLPSQWKLKLYHYLGNEGTRLSRSCERMLDIMFWCLYYVLNMWGTCLITPQNWSTVLSLSGCNRISKIFTMHTCGRMGCASCLTGSVFILSHKWRQKAILIAHQKSTLMKADLPK